MAHKNNVTVKATCSDVFKFFGLVPSISIGPTKRREEKSVGGGEGGNVARQALTPPFIPFLLSLGSSFFPSSIFFFPSFLSIAYNQIITLKPPPKLVQFPISLTFVHVRTVQSPSGCKCSAGISQSHHHTPLPPNSQCHHDHDPRQLKTMIVASSTRRSMSP